MSRASKVALLLAAIILLLAGSSWGQDTTPAFTPKDRDLIDSYYKHLIGTLAPGSLNRTPLQPEVEKALVKGSHVPLQFEKVMQPLPSELESQLSQITGDYRRMRLGRHIVLVRRADLWIADILKNIGVAPK